MKYVDMSHAAWDSSTIIFPGLNNCHGIVYATTAGLYAFHANLTYKTSYNSNGESRIEAFTRFVRDHKRLRGAMPIGLFGMFPDSRPMMDVEAELYKTAQGIGYTGPIKIAKWSTQKLGWGSTWVIVTRGVGQKITVTIENYRSERDNNKPEIANPDPVDQKLATNDKVSADLATFHQPSPTDPETRRELTDWELLKKKK